MNYPLTLAQILEHAHRVHGSKRVTTLLPDQTFHRYTYTALYERVKRLANALTQLGVIQPGDRVGTYASNTYQHLELYAAIPCIGAVLHPLNVRLTAVQLARIVREAADKVFLWMAHTSSRLKNCERRLRVNRLSTFIRMPRVPILLMNRCSLEPSQSIYGISVTKTGRWGFATPAGHKGNREVFSTPIAPCFSTHSL